MITTLAFIIIGLIIFNFILLKFSCNKIVNKPLNNEAPVTPLKSPTTPLTPKPNQSTVAELAATGS